MTDDLEYICNTTAGNTNTTRQFLVPGGGIEPPTSGL